MRRNLLIFLSLALLLIAGGFGVWYWRSHTAVPTNTPYVEQRPTLKTANNEPIVYFSIWSWQAEHANLTSWDRFLDDIKSWGANTIITDVPWQGVEHTPGQFEFASYDPYLDHVRDHGLNVILVLDAGMLFGTDQTKPEYQAAPTWLFERYPEAASQDFDGTHYPQLSFTHKAGNEAYQSYLREAVQHYTSRYGDRMLAFNPNLNNQMETRFAQQGFKWQDYGPSARAEFAEYLQDEYGTVTALNARWHTSYTSFAEAPMLRVDYNQVGLNPDLDPRFVDLMQFRERALESAVQGASQTIKRAGGKVYLHFGEVLTKIDAIFTSPLELVARYADIVAVDCHHLTGDGSISDPSIVGVMVSHARGNGATVIYEDSVEPIAPPEVGQRRDVIVQESIRWAMRNGSAGLGVANFLQQWDKDGTYTWQRTLKQTMAERTAFTQKPVALLASRWMAYGVHASREFTKAGEPYDFWQTNLQGMFKLLEEAGVPVAVLSDEAIAAGRLADYDTLIAPYQFVVPEPTLATIKAWHARGGNLIADMRFAEFSLTGERDAQQIQEWFGLTGLQSGKATTARVSTAIDPQTVGQTVTIGDAVLEQNKSEGLRTLQAVTAGPGTTTYLEAQDGALLAINPTKNTAYLGYLPGLLYLQLGDAALQKTLQQQVLFALRQLR
ncbi:MAG: alpha-amylase family protein [Candidatus Andersenbacteria bacterium]